MDKTQDSFNLLRLAAAASVLVSHQFALLGRPEPHLVVDSLGMNGVCVFFVISGFMVSQSWTRDPNLLRFFTRRALRLFPALVAVVLVTVFLLGPFLTSMSAAEYFADIKTLKYLSNIYLRNHFTLPGLFASNPYPNAVNGSLWTLLPEMKMYVGVAVLGVLLISRYMVLAYALVAAALAFLWNPPPINDPILYLSAYFAAGITLAKFPRFVSWRVLGFVAVIAALVGTLTSGGRFAVWMVLPLLTILVGRAKPPKPVSRLLRGDWSYGVYLYAFPIQQTVIALGVSSLPQALLLSAVPTLLCAMASWEFVERRALSLKPRHAAYLPSLR